MATGTTVFSRVTVVAPGKRIDMALPADVSVADLLPMLLERAQQVSPDGGTRHGGWCLAKLNETEPLDPSQTLASLGVYDGDILQLRRRSDNPPPPLYDDVVDALAEAEPGSYRPWTKETAAKVGHAAGALALIAAAVALGIAGAVTVPGTSNLIPQIIAAVTGVIVAIFATGVGSVIARAHGAATTGTVIAGAGGLSMAFVAGLNIVPGGDPRPKLLLACALVLIFASVSIMVIGAGIVVFIGAATASAFAVVSLIVATVIPSTAPFAMLPGVAAGAAAVGLAGISILPRMTMQLAKLPLPHVPGNAEDLKEDSGFPDYKMIERRAGLAHQYMTGLIIGCGVTAAIGAVIASTASNIFGPILAVVVAAVLMLRGRNYVNGSQALALLLSGLLAALGLTVGLLLPEELLTVGTTTLWKLMVVFPALLVIGILAVIFGVVFPNRRFSPVQRRSVDLLEAVLIASVLPLALGVMDLYMTIRDLNLNLF